MRASRHTAGTLLILTNTVEHMTPRGAVSSKIWTQRPLVMAEQLVQNSTQKKSCQNLIEARTHRKGLCGGATTLGRQDSRLGPKCAESPAGTLLGRHPGQPEARQACAGEPAGVDPSTSTRRGGAPRYLAGPRRGRRAGLRDPFLCRYSARSARLRTPMAASIRLSMGR